MRLSMHSKLFNSQIFFSGLKSFLAVRVKEAVS